MDDKYQRIDGNEIWRPIETGSRSGAMDNHGSLPTAHDDDYDDDDDDDDDDEPVISYPSYYVALEEFHIFCGIVIST